MNEEDRGLFKKDWIKMEELVEHEKRLRERFNKVYKPFRDWYLKTHKEEIKPEKPKVEEVQPPPEPGVKKKTPSITCLDCEFTSHNINDVINAYCGHCHEYKGDRAVVQNLDDGRREREVAAYNRRLAQRNVAPYRPPPKHTDLILPHSEEKGNIEECPKKHDVTPQEGGEKVYICGCEPLGMKAAPGNDWNDNFPIHGTGRRNIEIPETGSAYIESLEEPFHFKDVPGENEER